MTKKIITTIWSLIWLSGTSQNTNPAPYCNSVNTAVQNGENSSITNVQFSTLNNTTGFAEGGSKYHYYDNLGNIPVAIGVTYTLSVSFGASPYVEPGYFAGYLDFNFDNSFSANELIFSNANTGGGTLPATASTRTATFSLMFGAAGMTTRLRIIRGEHPNNSPAYDPTYTLLPCPAVNPNIYLGEVEDYGILVDSPPVPTATFNMSSPLCAGQIITTTNLSTNNASVWSWNMPGASSPNSTQQNPTLFYPAPGNYTVTLVATNAGGPSVPYSKTITVHPNPTITVTSAAEGNTPAGILCRGRTATLTASGATTYSWNTNATTAAIAVSPITTTDYTVTGTSLAGCKTTLVKTQSVSVCTGLEYFSRHTTDISVFPNPGNGNFFVTIHAPSENMELSVYDTVGKLLFTKKAEEENQIHLEGYAHGVYFLRIIKDGMFTQTKLLIEN